MKSLFVNMATEYTKEWIRFFTGCGIPDEVATMYALIFYENRIQKNMLLDLNKEYLRDMGITVMGDVIAILRYAKVIHKKYVSEKILSDNDDVPLNLKNESSGLIKKSMSAKRMLEHYTRKSTPLGLEQPKYVQVIVPNNKNPSVLKNSEDNLETRDTLLSASKKVEKQNFKTKEVDSEIPVVKVRRVLPENEGGYKIKMPLGTTERSKKILEQAKKRELKTVFDRLGESSVSSTTSEVSSVNSNRSNCNNDSSTTTKEKSTSVFLRLGEKTSHVSSTSSSDHSEHIFPEQLPYVGILKGSGSQKKGFLKTTMRADNEPQKITIGKLGSEKSISVKKRLGLPGYECRDTNLAYQTKAHSLKHETPGEGSMQGSKNIFSRSNSELNEKSNKRETQFSSQNIGIAKPISDTMQVQKAISVKNLKRKLDEPNNCDENLSKKVRFGSTTLRLIPPSLDSSKQSGFQKYSKLTMIIDDRRKPIENLLLQSSVKTGILNRDKMRGKISLAGRIGTKFVQKRLDKREGVGISGISTSKKSGSIRDRLG